MHIRSLIFFFLSILPADMLWSAAHTDSLALAQRARDLFYASVENKDSLDVAIAAFYRLADQDSSWTGVAQTYIGALTALKAKYTRWPTSKWQQAKKGLQIMDAGLAHSPDNIEALFIHGSTCHYLPFFFKRQDDAQRSFARIVELLPDQAGQYSSSLITHMIDFLLRKANLKEKARQDLRAIGETIENHTALMNRRRSTP